MDATIVSAMAGVLAQDSGSHRIQGQVFILAVSLTLLINRLTVEY